MKVFISWSGEESHKVALALREWLPSVVQSIDPYVSSEDIDKGTRWASDIAGELDESAFGILCVTKQNLDAPWLNFEAGALGKSVDKSRVCPVLFRIKRSEISGPILQFQSTVIEKDDVFKLLKSINDACGTESIDETRLEKGFLVWWPSLDEELNKIPKASTGKITKVEEPENPTEKILEEILQLSRSSQMILRSPEEILPVDYINHAIEKSNVRSHREPSFRHPAIRDIVKGYRHTQKVISEIHPEMEDHPEIVKLISSIRSLEEAVEYLNSRSRNVHRRTEEFDF
ncbi:toll/interleukin-1 receptor domain-containing protein [Photobacterium sanguinicancri]|uniref:toll/interleukin-1 receptor domain-containing protein n=1 Tax=Photobacterium sanguinicancri TaxID=875932 RepID=UPI003D14D6F1